MGHRGALHHHITNMGSQTLLHILHRRNRATLGTTHPLTTPSSLLKAMDTMRPPSNSMHLRRQVTRRTSKGHRTIHQARHRPRVDTAQRQAT